MPISTPSPYSQEDPLHFQHVREELLEPAIRGINFSPISPEASGSELIHSRIVKSLETADLVLCDISNLNPNVFFELGIRSALNKPVTLIKDNQTKNIPFDTSLILG